MIVAKFQLDRKVVHKKLQLMTVSQFASIASADADVCLVVVKCLCSYSLIFERHTLFSLSLSKMERRSRNIS